MATGRLGASDLSATTNTTVYTCPEGIYTVASINICNRGANTTSIRVAVSDADTPTNAEFIEYEADVFSQNVIERTGLVLSAGQRIVVYSTEASVSAVVFGIETTA